jgi:hypothetical protein
VEERKRVPAFGSRGEESTIESLNSRSDWDGIVSRLIETPPTPPLGGRRVAQKVHCEGSDYFSAAATVQPEIIQSGSDEKEIGRQLENMHQELGLGSMDDGVASAEFAHGEYLDKEAVDD